MANVKITFQKCVQDSLKYGSDDKHMVSRVFFIIEVDGKYFGDFSIDIKQLFGSDFKSTPIEFGTLEDYKGPLNYETFYKSVEDYYRELVGSAGRGIGIKVSDTFRMYNNPLVLAKTVEFQTVGSDAGW